MSHDDPIYVVSGLPRSGTSLMMQMLRAGGLPVLSDGVRDADVDNPWGYYEDERTKRLRADASWLGEARGRAVKIVSPLLFELPSDHRYQIVFMRRPLEDVLASQAKMLARRGEHCAEANTALRESLILHLDRVGAWLRQQPNVETLYVSYPRLLTDPSAGTRRIQSFIRGELDVQAMARQIHPVSAPPRGSCPSRLTPSPPSISRTAHRKRR